jgi:hypothetical protein
MQQSAELFKFAAAIQDDKKTMAHEHALNSVEEQVFDYITNLDLKNVRG